MNKKKTNWAIAIAWMCLIFALSHTAGDESSEQSELLLYIFNTIGLDLNSWFGEATMWILRKGAHTFEYFLLYILLYRAIKLHISDKKRYAITLLCIFLYACTDEYHQTFVEGRYGCFQDVMIDTAGGTLGMILILVVEYVKNRRKK